MTSSRTVQTVAMGLVMIVLISTIALAVILWDVANSDTEFDPALLLGLQGIATGALGGLIGLLASPKSVDVDAVAERAKADVLSEVEALGPNTMGQGD